MGNKSDPNTSGLLQRLFKTPDLKVFLQTNDREFLTETFVVRVQRLCTDRGLVAEHVIKNCGIDRTYGHQLFNGVRQPSRDKVIQLAFGFPLTVEETQELLKAAGKSLLYPRIKRDAVLLYCLKNRSGFIDVQAALQELSLPLLGREGRYE